MSSILLDPRCQFFSIEIEEEKKEKEFVAIHRDHADVVGHGGCVESALKEAFDIWENIINYEVSRLKESLRGGCDDPAACADPEDWFDECERLDIEAEKKRLGP
jgi:hypothetical protein